MAGGMMREEIKMMALDLAQEESMITHCPFCGAKHEKTFSMTRKADGIVYHCFRASCGASGFVGSNSFAPVYKKEFEGKPYTGQYWYDDVHPTLAYKFDIGEAYLSTVATVDDMNDHNLLPVYNINGRKAGWQLRKFDGSQPKAILYYDRPGPYVQMYRRPRMLRSKGTVFLVEDYFSMLKVQEVCDALQLPAMAVSLMGTDVQDEVALWLAKHFNHVVFMLDPNAIHKSMRYARKHRLLWDSVNIVQLEDDPKDSSQEVLIEIVQLNTR
jgi:hypothetical protein